MKWYILFLSSIVFSFTPPLYSSPINKPTNKPTNQINGVFTEWVEMYGTGSKSDGALFPNFDIKNDKFPGFVVPAGSLGFSVICFNVCALVALALLQVRRSVRNMPLFAAVSPAVYSPADYLSHKYSYIYIVVVARCRSFVVVSS